MSTKMKAYIYTEYGGPEVLQLVEVEKPTPKEDEVLVKVQAVSINIGDWYMLSGKPFLVRLMGMGVRKPKNQIIGNDVAGRVVAVGRKVKGFQPGDEVYGESGFGAFAEYATLNENNVALKPANLTFEEAAAVPVAAATALLGVRDSGQVQPGQKVLINGASGGVGTYAVQIAKAYGTEVTAVVSTSKMDMVRSIGADHAVDYTREDFTKNGAKYDVIFGVNGHRSLSEYKQALAPDGVYVCIGGTMKQIFESMLLGPLMSLNSRQKIMNMGVANATKQELSALNELIEAGKVVPVIDRCYPITEIAEAFRYVGKGHARGKVVLSMEAAESWKV